MDTAGEYRHRAISCLRLASEARESYVKVALTELAIELSSLADSVETCGIDQHRPKNFVTMPGRGAQSRSAM